MVDRWTFIRRCAHGILAAYADEAGHPAFDSEGGSHRFLTEIARLAFDEYYLDMQDEMLPLVYEGQLSRIERSISVRADVPEHRKPYIAAHEMGHLALDHPARDFQGQSSDGASESQDNDGPINDEACHIDEQPHTGALSQIDKVLRAYNPRDRWELEANVFAAELLAPLHEVRGYTAANPGWTVEQVAAYFGLSKEATRNQLVAALVACPHPDPLDKSPEPAPEDPSDPLEISGKQVEAAYETPDQALVVAGPGAGKTRVLAARCADLVNRHNADPNRILALTFSNKAVAEMRHRLHGTVPRREHEFRIFTFHSFGLEILCAYGGYMSAPIVLTDADAFVFLRSRIHRLPLGSYSNLANPTLYLGEILQRITRLKDLQIAPEEFEQRVQDWQTHLNWVSTTTGGSPQQEDQQKDAAKCEDLARIYTTYQRWLEEENYLDYSDLINKALALFEDPAIAQTITREYDRILVDEFQDVDRSCTRLLRALNPDGNKVWTVCDPRQTIYGFRGASLTNLASYEADYPTAPVVKLDVNYRSFEDIVAAGAAIPFPKIPGGSVFDLPRLNSYRGESPSPPAIHIGKASSFAVEINNIIEVIKRIASQTRREDIAILCRNRYQARRLSTALESEGIPTNWSGQPEEQEAFKDLMAVLCLADNRPLSLLRLVHLEEHYLDEIDLRLILAEAAKQGGKLHRALDAASKGAIAGLSEAARESALALKRLSGRLHACKTAWNALAVYLFEETQWMRSLIQSNDPRSRRYVATMCQVIDLAREFSLKGSISAKTDISAFLDYISSARETGNLPCPDMTPVIADAVNILTIHKSKGLEWPVVFVPDWDFSPYNRPGQVPLPSHLLMPEGASIEGEEEFGRSCLAYVAVTRAKDQLWISYSVPDPKFIPEVCQALGVKVENYVIRRPEWRERKHPLHLNPFQSKVIDYPMIRQYSSCPKRAEYDYIYKLRTESNGYLFYVRGLRATLAWIVEGHNAGKPPTSTEIECYVTALWERDLKPERRLSPFYKDQAVRCAQTFAARLIPGTLVSLFKRWNWPLSTYASSDGTVIRFRIDEITNLQAETNKGVARLHRYDATSGRQSVDPILALYVLLEESGHEIRLHYLVDGEETVIESAAWPETFAQHQNEIQQVAREIKRGYFPAEPKPKSTCQRCPYNLICST